jgi:hypothetical protein
MYDLFYVIRVREDWYRLHIKDTHYCISACDSLDSIERTIKRLITTFKTKDRLLRHLSTLEDKGVENEKTTEVYRNDYMSFTGDYEDWLRDIVSEALKEVRENSTYKKVSKRLKGLKRPVVKVMEKTPERPERTENDCGTPLKRPKVINRTKRLLAH